MCLFEEHVKYNVTSSETVYEKSRDVGAPDETTPQKTFLTVKMSEGNRRRLFVKTYTISEPSLGQRRH